MSFFERVLNPLGFISQKQFTEKVSEAVKGEIDKNLPAWLGETAEAHRWEMPDPSIFANQADMYRISPILGTAVSILGSDIGTSKFNVKRMVGEDVRDIPNHPYELLLRNPNEMWSGLEFANYLSSNYLLNGNAVKWLNRLSADSTPDEMWPIPFSRLTPITDKVLGIDHWDYDPGNGRMMRLEKWEIVHYKSYNPNNYFIGLSPLESLAETIQGDIGMRKTNRVNYVEHNGAPPSILAFKDFVGNEVWGDVKAEKERAAKKNEMMMLRGVGDGVSWMSRALSNKDNDFIAGLRQNLTDVFNRMCPGLIAMLSENATEANALAARATYAEKTLWPMLEVFAQKDTSDILPAYGRKLVGVFDDPRVVDKKLKLEEQKQYSLTHTIDQINKEYYQEDPLQDERGKLFPSQINAQSGGIQEPPPPPPGNLPQAETEQQPEQMDSPELVNEDTKPAKAALDDLAKWQRKALKKVGAKVDFASENVPADIMGNIAEALPTCKTEAAVKAVFEQARQNLKPKGNEAAIVLQGLMEALKAL